MNSFFPVFLFGLLISLVCQASQGFSPYSKDFHNHFSYDLWNEEISPYLVSQNQFENQIYFKKLNSFYQERIPDEDSRARSLTKIYPLSKKSWIKEKTCLKSPYIHKPIQARITSRFGRRVHPLSRRRHIHSGIDFRGKKGTLLWRHPWDWWSEPSLKEPTVKTVVVDHGHGFTTLYAHLSGYSVKPGQWVSPGQVIGTVGYTGRATGPHLHFEIRCHNVPLNPMRYLEKKGLISKVRFKVHKRSLSKSDTFPEKRDPNYYTRLMNLEKLRQLDSASSEKL